MNCPFTGKDADLCGMAEAATSEGHLQWHFDYEVSRGQLVKNPDGSYSLPETMN